MGCCFSRDSTEFAYLKRSQLQALLNILEPGLIFTSGEGGEVVSYRFSASRPGCLSEEQSIPKQEGATFVEWLAVHPNRKRLYAFSCFWKPMEKVQAKDTRQGSLVVFEIDGQTGQLTQRMVLDSLGHHPCAAECTTDGSMLGVAHYLDGSITLFPLSEAGDPLPEKARVLSMPWRNEGEDTPRNEERIFDGLTGPLCHGLAFSPSGRWVVACDAGQSRIVSFGIAPENAGTVVVTDVVSTGVCQGCLQSWIADRVGARPRHLCFYPDGSKIYVLFECTNQVTTHCFDDATGSVGECIQALPSMGPRNCGFPCCLLRGVSAAAEIEVSKDGQFLFLSNRGIFSGSSLAAFSFQADGTLSFVGETSALGSGPRHFTQHDNLLLAGLEQSKGVAVFDTSAGSLSPIAVLGMEGAKRGPQCVRMWMPPASGM